jgi:hypothetical protein
VSLFVLQKNLIFARLLVIAESTYKIKAELSNNAGKIVEVKLSKDFVNKDEALAFSTALLTATLVCSHVSNSAFTV